jgi:cysteine-rich repeat protein
VGCLRGRARNRSSPPRSVDSSETQHPLGTDGASISQDGAYVAFASRNVFVGPDPHDDLDVFVRGPDLGASPADLSGDGDDTDTMLRVFDAAVGLPAKDLCPAGAVAVDSGRAAFLRPEAAGPASTSPCTQAAQLNGDGDAADRVLFVRQVDPLVAGSCIGGLVDPALAGDAIAVRGNVVVVSTPEAAQCHVSASPESCDLNGDLDKDDRVLRIYLADEDRVIAVNQAVEDFGVGKRLVAFRTREASQGYTDLNDDSDPDDDVPQVYYLGDGIGDEWLVNSRTAVTPCPVEACDPRFPYRVVDGEPGVRADTVIYVTAEADQDEDLNGDEDTTDLIKQVFNVRQAPQPGSLASPMPLGAPIASAPEAVTPISAASLGVCSVTGGACAGDDDCVAGVCYVPPGRCAKQTANSCTCNPETGCSRCIKCAPEEEGCVPEFCVGSPSGFCYQDLGKCSSQDDQSDACGPGAVCLDAQADVQRLFAPIATTLTTGEAVYSAGACVHDLGTPCANDDDCGPGETCGAGGSCERRQGSCLADADCTAGFGCEPALIVAAAADSDGDALADPIDNCPDWPNPDRADVDGDELGDLCDALICGNGLLEPGEPCDDGNLAGGDGCSERCQVEECGNGLDDDGDGLVDHPADPECKQAWDASERRAGSQCGLGFEVALMLLPLAWLRRRRARARPR